MCIVEITKHMQIKSYRFPGWKEAMEFVSELDTTYLSVRVYSN